MWGNLMGTAPKKVRATKSQLCVEILEERTVLTTGVEAALTALPTTTDNVVVSMVQAAPDDVLVSKYGDRITALIHGAASAQHPDDQIREHFLTFWAELDFQERDRFWEFFSFNVKQEDWPFATKEELFDMYPGVKLPDAGDWDTSIYLNEAMEKSTLNLNSALEASSAPAPEWRVHDALERLTVNLRATFQRLDLARLGTSSLDMTPTLVTVPNLPDQAEPPAPPDDVVTEFVDLVPPNYEEPESEVSTTASAEVDAPPLEATAVRDMDWESFVMGQTQGFEATRIGMRAKLLSPPAEVELPDNERDHSCSGARDQYPGAEQEEEMPQVEALIEPEEVIEAEGEGGVPAEAVPSLPAALFEPAMLHDFQENPSTKSKSALQRLVSLVTLSASTIAAVCMFKRTSRRPQSRSAS